MSVDLGSGNDKLTLANTVNAGTIRNVETVNGGNAADAVTLATAIFNGAVDLGAGSDTLTLGDFTNTATVRNVETLTGGTGNDTIILGAAIECVDRSRRRR